MKTVTWQAPSNIAFIKYWGKKEGQIPLNASLSLSLKNAQTKTTLTWRHKEEEEKSEDASQLGLKFLFEGKENLKFQQRIYRLFLQLLADYPCFNDFHFTIESSNNFPHSTGIASSASSMASLALCLTSFLEEEGYLKGEFYDLASYLARLGSGSASRSIFGGFSLWGSTEEVNGSADEFAIDLEKKSSINIHPDFRGLRDSILIVSSESKKVSSREGHREMDHHFFREGRKMMVKNNLSKILKSLESGSFEDFADVVESEAYALHALMMSSNHPFCLLKPNTLEIINQVTRARKEKNLSVCFTLDAGPNVHLIYPRSDELRVKEFILYELKNLCENERVFWDEEGEGPSRLDEVPPISSEALENTNTSS